MTLTMPPPKKKPGTPPQNPNGVFVRLDDATAAALEEFLREQDVPPKKPAVLLAALREFLGKRGHLKSQP